MTDKRFYNSALEEVLAGQIDRALWVKVSTEGESENERTLQARYVKARAEELSRESLRQTSRHIVNSLRSEGSRLSTKVLKYAVICIVVCVLIIYPGFVLNELISSQNGVNSALSKINKLPNITPRRNYEELPTSAEIAYVNYVVQLRGSCEHLSKSRHMLAGELIYSFIANRNTIHICKVKLPNLMRKVRY